MKKKMKIPKSLKKHIRGEKARIRRTTQSFDEQIKLIEELYLRVGVTERKKDEHK